MIHQKDGTADIRFRYDPIFIDRLKLEVPGYERSYDPDSKTWTIHRTYVDRVLYMMRERFGHVEVYGKPVTFNFSQQHVNDGCQCDSAHRTLKVCQDAPPEVVKAAYRALSKANHPDHGGSHVTMIQITEAYETVIGGTG